MTHTLPPYPPQGDAFVFWSNRPDGTPDELAMHTGCPVVSGTKWVAIKWIHSKPFRPELYEAMPVGELKPGYDPNNDGGYDPAQCGDMHPQCKLWAEAGECKANAKYMVGDNFGQGACRAACGTCSPCDQGDKQCRDENRRSAGYLVITPEEMM
jgi:prolyl 4-hydroxylase